MTPALQTSVISQLNKRQLSSLRVLQNKVENGRGYDATVRVSAAQQAALQAAYSAAKASGRALTPEVAATAARLGLK